MFKKYTIACMKNQKISVVTFNYVIAADWSGHPEIILKLVTSYMNQNRQTNAAMQRSAKSLISMQTLPLPELSDIIITFELTATKNS